MRERVIVIILTLLPVLLPANTATAQGPGLLSSYEIYCMQADDLHRDYDFAGAVEFYRKALETCRDSLMRLDIQDKIRRCENGQSLMAYCSTPKVVAKERFRIQDFFLFYPLPDKSWHKNAGGRAVYCPETASQVYFTMPDTLSVSNIYETHWADTAWTAPVLAGDMISSPESEAFPMVDGDDVYFSSKGLYGMGGYDLYVSHRDPYTGEWGAPENMGFPYSSPADDFLFVTTSDEKYHLFASNRGCAPDSVYVYVIEYEAMPVRKAVDNAVDLNALAQMTPMTDLKKVNTKDAISDAQEDSPEMAMYSEKVSQLRQLRSRIAACSKELSEMREKYPTLREEQKEPFYDRILEKEREIPALQSELTAMSRELQKIEMDFLMNGVVIDPGKVREQSEKQVVGVSSSYTFTQKSFGSPLNFLNLSSEQPAARSGADSTD